MKKAYKLAIVTAAIALTATAAKPKVDYTIVSVPEEGGV